MIAVKNLSFFYHLQDGPILKEINFELKAGEILGIIGPNGGGKSTLLKILAGLLKPQSGEIITSEKRLAYLPQLSHFNPFLPLTVEEVLDQTAASEVSLVAEMLQGIELKNKLFRELSGGQQQRVLLARAFLMKPSLILLDEPFQGLDAQAIDLLLQALETFKKQNCSFILVDHHLQEILNHCDKILCLNKTQHWHNNKELFNQDIMKSIYHCEFEHLKIHQEHGPGEHKECSHHDHDYHDDDNKGDS